VEALQWCLCDCVSIFLGKLGGASEQRRNSYETPVIRQYRVCWIDTQSSSEIKLKGSHDKLRGTHDKLKDDQSLAPRVMDLERPGSRPCDVTRLLLLGCTVRSLVLVLSP
jgi:hypothetical protein